MSEPCVLWLTWRCLNCGWETTMRAPGFAGDGHDHFRDGRTPCGPLRAQKAWASEIAAEEARTAGNPDYNALYDAVTGQLEEELDALGHDGNAEGVASLERVKQAVSAMNSERYAREAAV